MDLRFVGPDLRQISSIGGEIIASCLFEDERPVRGVAGLLDWRLSARLSFHMSTGNITGASGEKVIIPGKPRLPFEKILLFGLGKKNNFDEKAFLNTIHQITHTFGRLRVRTAVIERPGRHTGAVDAVRATVLITEICEQHGGQDVWTLVESVPDQKRIAQHVEQERRRKRLR